MHRSFFYIIILIISIVFILIPIKNLNKNKQETQNFTIMGTYLSITIKGTNTNSDIVAAYNRIKKIETLINRFDPQSEISKINNRHKNTIKISSDTYNCIELAQKVSYLTNGAFDITLSGDYKNIILISKNRSITFKKPRIKLNLDGIAKGYAVEEARKLLFERGIKDGIIDMGSSIAVFDMPKKVGIRNPFKKDEFIAVITLNSREALSTSGTYEQGLHIINPKIGKPANELIGITITGLNAGLLDGLSTGIFVMGIKNGFIFSKKQNIPVIMILKDGKILKNKI